MNGDSAALTCEAGTAPAPHAVDAGTWFSNPTATQTATGTGYILHKELSGYSNYGAQDGAADVLYNGEITNWTFTLPAGNIVSATLVMSVIADDTGQTTSDYSFEFWSNACVYSGPALPHGSPAALRFTNWVTLSDPAGPLNRPGIPRDRIT